MASCLASAETRSSGSQTLPLGLEPAKAHCQAPTPDAFLPGPVRPYAANRTATGLARSSPWGAITARKRQRGRPPDTSADRSEANHDANEESAQ